MITRQQYRQIDSNITNRTNTRSDHSENTQKKDVQHYSRRLKSTAGGVKSIFTDVESSPLLHML